MEISRNAKEEDRGQKKQEAQVKMQPALCSHMLQRLLEQNRKFHPVLRGGAICNHYSMAILAAHNLGADDTQLRVLHDMVNDRSRLPYTEVQSGGVSPIVQHDDWARRVGDMQGVPAFRDYFRKELESQGPESVLAQHVPKLVPGQHKGLFHPMIRLCFACQSPSAERTEEIAEALAYSSGRYEPIYPTAPQDFAVALGAAAKKN